MKAPSNKKTTVVKVKQAVKKPLKKAPKPRTAAHSKALKATGVKAAPRARKMTLKSMKSLAKKHSKTVFKKIDVFAAVIEEKKRRVHQRFAALFLAMLLAVGINSAMFATNMGAQMQAAVIGAVSTEQSAMADIGLAPDSRVSNVLSLKAHRDMKAVKEVRAIVVWNPQSFRVDHAFTTLVGSQVVVTPDESGVTRLYITFSQPTDIVAGTGLAEIVYRKKADESVSVGLSDTTFRAGGIEYELSSESIEIK